ncbi:MAG TPA: fibronectin type III domain-containing protein [Acidimicrobiales bacterium]|nr:fibronectin type III domain-containing protein [Acidimicrobiales bacterium]
MKSKLKRLCSGLAVIATAGTLVPLFTADVASAAGVPSGAAEVRNPGGTGTLSSGTSATNFTLRLPDGAACEGDTANDFYTVSSYMVPSSVDPSTLTWDSTGPFPNGVGASFRQPLYDTTTSPYVGQPTLDNAGSPRPRPGEVINIPDFNFGNVFTPGQIPAGAYNVGIACIAPGPTGPNQLKQFWNTTMTVTTDAAGGPAQVSWSVGSVPAAPSLATVTAGDSSASVAFTAVASTPATTGYTVTATPTGGGAPVTATGADSPINVPGLTNGTQYSFTVRATNSTGNSAESNAITATPNLRPVSGLSAAASVGQVDLSWTAPAGTAPSGYSVTVSPAAGTTTVSGTTSSTTGLSAGTVYTFTVTPTYPAGTAGTPASAQISATPQSASNLVENVTVTRPVGALVLTQVCGTNGPIAADTSGTMGFPNGSLPAIPADASGTAPTTTAGGTTGDPKFSEYPYPENPDGTAAPTYPTHCGIPLGTAKFVKSGPGAGQFFAASGYINQITIVETRDTDLGWNATGTVSDFSAGNGKTFKGDQLGWTPVVTSDSPPFADADPATPDYDQTVTAGSVVNPNTIGGLGLGRTLGSAAGGKGLGIAQLDARLKLLIPVTAKTGDYAATLTISAI